MDRPQAAPAIASGFGLNEAMPQRSRQIILSVILFRGNGLITVRTVVREADSIHSPAQR